MSLNLSNIQFDEWRSLDPKEPWSWPAVPKALAMVGVTAVFCLLGYFGVVSSQQDDLGRAAAEQTKLMEDYKAKYEQGVHLDAYKEQRVAVEKTFGELLRQLPSKAEMEELLNDVNAAGTGRGLVFELFKPAAAENLYDFYAEQPIAIKITGTYHDFGEFASAVAHLDRIVTINDLSVTVPATASGPSIGKLMMEATATTYRYLDKAEIQAQKQAAKGKGKGKGAKGGKAAKVEQGAKK